MVACLAPLIVNPPNVSRHSRSQDIGIAFLSHVLFIICLLFSISESVLDSVLHILRKWLSEYKELQVLVVPPLYRGTPSNFSDDVAVSMVFDIFLI